MTISASRGGNNKHLGEDVVQTIVRKQKQQEDQGKASEFQLRGRPITADQIDRNIKRRKKYTADSLAHLAESGPPTPEGLEVWMPPSIPLPSVPSNLTPTMFRIREQLLDGVRNFFNGSIPDGHVCDVDFDWISPWVDTNPQRMTSRLNLCNGLRPTFVYFFYMRKPHNVAQKSLAIVHAVIEHAKFLIMRSVPDGLESLLLWLLVLYRLGMYSRLIQVAEHVANISISTLGAGHPFSVFCSLWPKLEADEIGECLLQAWCFLTNETARFGETSMFYLRSNILYKQYVGLDRGVAFCRRRLARFNQRFLPHDYRTLTVLSYLGDCLHDAGDYVGAERVHREPSLARHSA